MKVRYLLCLIFAVTLALLYAFQQYYGVQMRFFSNAFPPFISGAVTIVAIFALNHYWESFRSKLSIIWLCFALGSTFWFLGELSWAVYTVILNSEQPYPSFADAFWVIGYFPFIIAIYSYIQLLRPALSKNIFRYAFISAVVIGLAVFVPLLFFAINAEEGLWALALDFMYPALDIVLFSGAHSVLLVFLLTRLRGKMELPWLLMSLAIFMILVGDALFSYATILDVYWAFPAHPLELFFHFGYMLMLLAFYMHTEKL